jgi:hypothetical protein
VKRSVIFALSVVIVLGTIILLIQRGPQSPLAPPSQTAPPIASGTALDVDEFMGNVTHYQPPVRVQGIVSAVLPEKQLLALIDAREFEQCKVTTCASLTLPVKWAGAMPTVQDTVRVEGEVKESRGKLIFVARTLERLDTPPRGPE